MKHDEHELNNQQTVVAGKNKKKKKKKNKKKKSISNEMSMIEKIKKNSIITKESEQSEQKQAAEKEEKEDGFDKLGLNPVLCKACKELEWKTPTDIQRKSIPYIMQNRDLIGLAETGSGKTGAFVLPVLNNLLETPQSLYCVILSPTRELSIQIHNVVMKLGKIIGVKSVCIVGGIDQMQQAIALNRKPHVVVASPGRLVDHLENTKGFHLRNLKVLILDEADRMLSEDFEEAINKLLSVIPKGDNRQTLLFSATMTSKVEKLQRACLRPNPAKVSVSSHRYQTVDSLIQQLAIVPAKFKDCWLVYILTQFTGLTAIIFASTCQHAQRISAMLNILNMKSISLHGKMSQPLRIRSLEKFKKKSKNILVATDVASRGLDIAGVDLVINYDCPQNSKDYVHRVGRTARAGKSGRAITFVSQYELMSYQRIENALNKKLDMYEADKETVLVLLERVNEAQRLAAIEIRNNEANDDGKRFKRRKY